MFKQISEYNAVPGLGKIPLMERRFPKVNRKELVTEQEKPVIF